MINLHEWHKINDCAAALFTYKKTINNMVLISEEKYNSMPDHFKESYGSYENYKTKEKLNFSTAKLAIKTKLQEKHDIIDSLQSASIEEKAEWKNNISSYIASINGNGNGK